MTSLSEVKKQEVLSAANYLIRCYGAGDIKAYLACFLDKATFDFYFSEETFESLEEWAEEMNRLAAQGTTVLSCQSSNQRIQFVGSLVRSTSAIFRHDVTTVERDADGVEHTLYERETIVFELVNGTYWMAVHEHLSERPAPSA